MRTLWTYCTEVGLRDVILLAHPEPGGGYAIVDALAGRSAATADPRVVGANIATEAEAHDLATEHGIASALLGSPADEHAVRHVLAAPARWTHADRGVSV